MATIEHRVVLACKDVTFTVDLDTKALTIDVRDDALVAHVGRQTLKMERAEVRALAGWLMWDPQWEPEDDET